MIIIDAKTAVIERGAFAIVVALTDAGGPAQNILQRISVDIVNLLAGDDRNRLRRILDAQRQAGRGGHLAGGVGAGVLGAAVIAERRSDHLQGFFFLWAGSLLGPRSLRHHHRQAQQCATGEANHKTRHYLPHSSPRLILSR
ncbi:hypothetical protein D3C78_1548320 [compost metagenome]